MHIKIQSRILTTHRFKVIGLILNSATNPSSWYICSIRLSICENVIENKLKIYIKTNEQQIMKVNVIINITGELCMISDSKRKQTNNLM